MDGHGLDRLAEAVRSRRARLGMAQGDLAGRGGPSIVTVSKIERGEIAKPQATTLQRLDRALQWHEGSAAAVLAGGNPREQQTGDRPPGADIVAAIERELGLIPEARAHLVNQLELLLRLSPVTQPTNLVERQAERRQGAVEQAEVDEKIQQKLAAEQQADARARSPKRRGRPVP